MLIIVIIYDGSPILKAMGRYYSCRLDYHSINGGINDLEPSLFTVDSTPAANGNSELWRRMTKVRCYPWQLRINQRR